MLVRPQMIGQMPDPIRQDRHLDLRRTGVRFLPPVLRDKLRFPFRGQVHRRHVILLLVIRSIRNGVLYPTSARRSKAAAESPLLPRHTPMPSILIADKLASAGAEYLQTQNDAQVTVKTGLAGSDLAQALREHDGAVVRSAVKVTGEVLQECMTGGRSRLRAVARAGVGVDNIDLEAATRLGVCVMNSASASTITTAEHAFALLIALARNIGPAHSTVASGGWDRSRFVGRQLHGRTLGIVGLGRIGRTVAQRALAFGMKVIAYDPLINAESELEGAVPMAASFDTLIQQVDIVSFHVPKTDVTTGMLGRAQFDLARPGLLVVNAARGGIVDEDALLQAIESGQCGGAAIDVFTSEPPPEDHPLRNHPRILTTPHLGASTEEAQEAVAVDACKALLTYLRGEGLVGAVNVGGLEMDLSDRQRAFADLAGRMVALLGAAMDETHLTEVRITLRGESLAARADTIARLALADLLNRHLEEPVNLINAPLAAEQRHIQTQTVIAADHGEDRLAIEVTSKPHRKAKSSQPTGQTHRIQGAIYEDGLPRVTQLDGYAMDMVPAGPMVLLTNADEPGRIGLVGQVFGDASVNIAEMVIGRRGTERGTGQVAMMILKVDEAPDEHLLAALRAAPGILRVAAVELPPVANTATRAPA